MLEWWAGDELLCWGVCCEDSIGLAGAKLMATSTVSNSWPLANQGTILITYDRQSTCTNLTLYNHKKIQLTFWLGVPYSIFPQLYTCHIATLVHAILVGEGYRCMLLVFCLLSWYRKLGASLKKKTIGNQHCDSWYTIIVCATFVIILFFFCSWSCPRSCSLCLRKPKLEQSSSRV